MISADETANYSLFRDCLSAPLIAKFATKPSKASRKRTGRKFGTKISQALKLENDEDLDEGKDAEELTEFIDVTSHGKCLTGTGTSNIELK